MSREALVLAWRAAAALVVAACSAEQGDPAPAASSADGSAPLATPSTSMPTADALPIRSRAVTRSATVAGRVAEGTVLLRSGARWLVTDSATLEEFAPLPLDHAVVVPTASGGVLVGSEGSTVYRFDDPLGPGVPIHEATGSFVRDLGAVPGAVHFLPEDVYVDVTTGVATTTTDAAPLPPRNIVYVDDQRAVARFPMARAIFMTADGGRTWAPGPSGMPARVGDDDDGLLLEAAHLAFGAGSDAPPDVRWVGETLVDPLYAAAIGGVPLRSGAMLVQDGTRLARVDPRTGTVTEMIEVSEGPWGCSLANALEGPVAMCASSSGLSAHAVREGPLSLGPGVEAGGASLVSTPAGGIAREWGCKAKNVMPGTLCIRQPDGSWATLQAHRPRPDGSGITWSFGPDATIEVVGRDGSRRPVAAVPEDRDVVDVSEDEEGRLWILAGRGGVPAQGLWRKWPDAWFVGELVGSTLAWAALEDAHGAPEPTEHVHARCGLMGRRTVCAVDGGVHVREGRGAPRFLHVASDGGVRVTQLGFWTGRGVHLGFEQSEAPRVLDEEPVPEAWPALTCRSAGPFVPAASPEWEEPPQERWNGADGASVRMRFASSIVDHFVRDDVEGIGVDLHQGFAIARVEASGFSVVWPTTWSAARARFAADRPSGPLTVGELRRADGLGLRPLLAGRRCAPGEAGDPLSIGAYVPVDLDGEPLDADSMETKLHVVDGPSGACLARLVGTSEGRQIRFDAWTGRANLARRDVEPGSQALRCTLRASTRTTR